MRVVNSVDNTLFFRVVDEIKKNGISVVYLDNPEKIQNYRMSVGLSCLNQDFHGCIKDFCDIIKIYTKECMVNLFFLDFAEDDSYTDVRMYIGFAYHAEKNWIDI